jgi:hypothetical protein
LRARRAGGLTRIIEDVNRTLQVATVTITYFTATPDGPFRAAIQVSEADRRRYLDKSWRVR